MAFGRQVTLARSARPDPTSLLVLGWASLHGDEPSQALDLFERALAMKETDELLQGRALALVRLGRHPEAVTAFEKLRERFSESHLSHDSAFELAIARCRAGHPCAALMDLKAIGEPAFPDQSTEMPQWLDAILQFAPIDQLVTGYAEIPNDHPLKAELRKVIRGRAIAAENFSLARRFLDAAGEADEEGNAPAQEKEPAVPRMDGSQSATTESTADLPDYATRNGPGEEPVHWSPATFLSMDAARWAKEVEPLATAAVHLAALPAGNADVAKVHLELAGLWRDARGRLTLPFSQNSEIAESEPEKLDRLRRRNAALLGLAPAEVERELHSRDELHHALDHFLKAAELSKDPNIAVAALAGANDALFRLAEFSLYQADRAVETHATDLSATLVKRLKTEFPEHPESKHAVTWTFVPPSLLGAWMPGDYSPWNCVNALVGSVTAGAEALHNRHDMDGNWGFPRELRAAMDLLAIAPLKDSDTLRAQLNALRSKFEEKRPHLSRDEINGLVTDLDDLQQVAAVPGMTPDLFSRYAKVRLKSMPIPEAREEWEPLAPFLAFTALARSQELGEYEAGRDEFRRQISDWESFLAKYPNSPKSEAASFRLLRLKVRWSCPTPQIDAFMFPEAPIPNGYKRVYQAAEPKPEVSRALSDALAAHRRKYPKGRYGADLNVLQGAVDISLDPPKALGELCAAATDEKHPELTVDAALYFAGCAQRLLNPDERMVYADAFRKCPEALALLHKLAYADTCLSRLRPMLPWLEEK